MGSMLFHAKRLQADLRLSTKMQVDSHRMLPGQLGEGGRIGGREGGGIRVRGGGGRHRDREPGRGKWGATAVPDHQTTHPSLPSKSHDGSSMQQIDDRDHVTLPQSTEDPEWNARRDFRLNPLPCVSELMRVCLCEMWRMHVSTCACCTGTEGGMF